MKWTFFGYVEAGDLEAKTLCYMELPVRNAGLRWAGLDLCGACVSLAQSCPLNNMEKPSYVQA